MGGYTPTSYRNYRSRKYDIESFKHAIAVWQSFSERQRVNILDGLGWDV